MTQDPSQKSFKTTSIQLLRAMHIISEENKAYKSHQQHKFQDWNIKLT